MASGPDLDAYLARIGERAPLAPGLDGLASLHRAHALPAAGVVTMASKEDG